MGDDETPLHIAVFTGYIDMVKLLLTSGANPNAPTKDAYTTLHVASKRGLKEMLSTLLDAGANVEAKNKRGFTALHIAAKHGQVSAMKMLMHYSNVQKSHCDVNAQGRNQLTPLHLAVHYNQLEAVQFLLENRANPYCRLLIAQEMDPSKIVNAESNLGFTALHLACQEGHEDMVSLLIQHKVDVKHHAQNGLVPLHLAAEADKVVIAQMLIMAGSEISPRTKAGYTPLHTAAHLGHLAMCRFLLQQPGLDVNEPNHNNCTALHLATKQGHSEVVQLLLDSGANPNLTNSFNLLPVQIAFGEHYVALYDRLKLVTTEITTEEMRVDEQWYASYKEKPEFLYEQVMSESEDEHGSEEDRLEAKMPKLLLQCAMVRPKLALERTSAQPISNAMLPSFTFPHRLHVSLLAVVVVQRNKLSNDHAPDQWLAEPVLPHTQTNGYHKPVKYEQIQDLSPQRISTLKLAGGEPGISKGSATADIWNELEYMRSTIGSGKLSHRVISNEMQTLPASPCFLLTTHEVLHIRLA
ncbi:Ankyrin-3 [Cichlidogyrus casuarinus]|uniref:Ankyrin-3 n=1 Tax=Cichlidogyrus casuarinus TaxID=1844966 RepID=A0ABD2QH40_9PLAT